MTQSADFFERFRLEAHPLANDENVVVCDGGQVRFTILTSRMIRLEWAEDGLFDDRASYAFPNRRGPAVQFQARRLGNMLMIDTNDVKLRYKEGTGRWNHDNLTIHFVLNRQEQIWRPGTPDVGNLRGCRRTLDLTYCDAGLEPGLVSRGGWTVFDDTGSMRLSGQDGWAAPPSTHPHQDCYFFGYGHDYKAALADYALFGGEIPMIPRFALGLWWSRYWVYSEQELRELLAEFEAHDTPLDVLVIDMDWHREGWTGYSWNRDLFPDPPAFLQWCRERGLHLTLNLHPHDGVKAHEDAYPDVARHMDVDPASAQPIPFRVSDKRFMEAYFKHLHHPHERDGIEFWWIDWQQGGRSEQDGLDPLVWLNHLHYMDNQRPGQRGLIFSRWGGLGNHRYPIGFSGDTSVTWEALAFQPLMTAAGANVLYGWWSHDIGGHVGTPGDELYARWVQFGALSPCLRLHGCKDPIAERRPWAFNPQACAAALAAIALRYELLPYLYTQARVAYDTSVSLCRPMYYDWPEHEDAYLARGQYMLGDQLLAAPITSPADPATGLASVDVWLPPGEWTDYQTHEDYRGPGWVRLSGGLDRIPLLARSGAIIPIQTGHALAGQTPGQRMTLAIFPGRHGQTRVYEDDGQTLAYLQREYAWTQVTMVTGGPRCEIVIEPDTQHQCPALPRERAYQLQLHQTTPPAAVQVNGHPCGQWTHNAPAGCTTIDLPPCPSDQIMRVELQAKESVWAPAQVAPRREPLIKIFDHILPEEATVRLGTVMVACGGGPKVQQCEAVWHWHHHGRSERFEQQQTSPTGETIVMDAPFAATPQDSTMWWEVQLTVHLEGGQTRTQRHTSAPLYPAVGHWQWCEAPASQPPSHWLDAEGFLKPELKLTDGSRWPWPLDHLTQWFQIPLPRVLTGGTEAENTSPILLVQSIVESPTAQRVRIKGMESRSWQKEVERFEVLLNGRKVELAARGLSEPVELREGLNALVVWADPEPYRLMGFAVVGEDGAPLTDLIFH